MDFGDFSWFRMDKILTARLVGGFARAFQVIVTTSCPDKQFGGRLGGIICSILAVVGCRSLLRSMKHQPRIR